jgi:hypothetical protein
VVLIPWPTVCTGAETEVVGPKSQIPNPKPEAVIERPGALSASSAMPLVNPENLLAIIDISRVPVIVMVDSGRRRHLRSQYLGLNWSIPRWPRPPTPDPRPSTLDSRLSPPTLRPARGVDSAWTTRSAHRLASPPDRPGDADTITTASCAPRPAPCSSNPRPAKARVTGDHPTISR